MRSPDWRRTLVLMVVLQSTMATAFNVPAPFMPFFLAQLGVHPTAAVALWTGAIAAVAPLVIAAVSPFWGALADRTGRKPMVVRCCIATAICFGGMPFSTQPWHVFVLYAVSGAVGGFSAAAMTLVGTQAPEGRLGFALGWMTTGQLVGGLFGPVLGGILSDHIHAYREIFAVTAALIVVGALLTTSFVQERFEPPPATRERPSLLRQAAEIARHPTLLPLVFVLLFAQLTAYAAIPIIPLYVRSLVGDIGWLGAASGIAIASTGVAGALATPWLGRLGDRIGHRRVLLGSLAGVALFTFPQAIAGSLGAFVALRFCVGLFLGGILPSANALIGGAFPREHRGRIYGITSSASYLGLAIGPALGGFVGGRFGFSAVFVVVGALVFVMIAFVAAGRPAPTPARAS